MDTFVDLMYDMILESLCDYVESGELDMDEAEVISEAAYDELFESRAIDRYAQRTLDEDKRIKEIESRGPKNLAEQFQVKRHAEKVNNYNDLVNAAREKIKYEDLRRTGPMFDNATNTKNARNAKDKINDIIARRSGEKLNPQELSLDARLERLAKRKEEKKAARMRRPKTRIIRHDYI